MSITISPNIQMTALGSFVLESDGVITGTAWPDPSTRYALAGGVLDESEVLPMWGGLPIQELIPFRANAAPLQARPELGGHIKRAIDVATITGFSVFDQNYAAINTPQSPVPQTDRGGFVSYYRLGSGARIAVPMDPAMVLEGLPVNYAAIAWDFTNNWLTGGAGFAGIRVIRTWPGNCMAPVYDGGPAAGGQGFLTWDRNAAAAIIIL